MSPFAGVGGVRAMDQVLRVLLVADDVPEREAARHALARAGVHVETAGDGVELLARLASGGAGGQEGAVDCVLLDSGGVGRDGAEVIRAVRAAGHGVPVIVLTDAGQAAAVAVGLMKAGASDCLEKGRASAGAVAASARAAVRVRRAEERAERALREREEATALLDTLMGEAPVGFAFLDRALRYVRVNRWLAQINGVPADAHLGRTLDEVVPRVGTDVGAAMRRVLETGEPIVGAEVTGETPASPGVPHAWLVSYYPVRSAGGAVLGVGVAVVDITERKRVEAELAKARDEAEGASRAKDRFLAVLSHELRTPLAPVLLAVQALDESGQAGELGETLAMIRRNVELEARLIDDLLDLTRIAKGKLQLHLREADAHELVGTAVDICRPEADAQGLRLVTELSASRRAVVADPARLQQVFWNLINNAIKFTPAGGLVRVRTYDDADGHLAIEVSDTGIGIEPDVLPRIFDAFEQGEGTVTRTFGGLGLGLAICRALVRMHAGQVSAHSPGRGSGAVFTVRLAGRVPAAGAPPAPTDAAARNVDVPCAPAASGGGGGGAKLRVLMVDDHADTRKAMQRILERGGFDVRTAGTVRDALDAAGDAPVDILISDIGLPDGSGLDIMRELRGRGAAPACGIAVSGFGMEEDVRRSREAGFSHHLTKPITYDRLAAVLREMTHGAAGPR